MQRELLLYKNNGAAAP